MRTVIYHFCFFCVVMLFAAAFPCNAQETYNTWDLTSFGEMASWPSSGDVLGAPVTNAKLIEVPRTADNEWNIGAWWQEERDVVRIEVTHSGAVNESLAKAVSVEYWNRTWPGEPPRLHTIEDRADDPWQGEWTKAAVNSSINGRTIAFTFKPLTTEENGRAGNLPEAVVYRRTMKIRLVYTIKPSAVTAFHVYSPTKEKKVSCSIEFLGDTTVNSPVEGSLEIFNGRIGKVSGWGLTRGDTVDRPSGWKLRPEGKPKGIRADIITASPDLPGSNDLTIMTVRSSRGTFSFLVDDLDKGPIYIPLYAVFIKKADDATTFAGFGAVQGRTIRDQLRVEPEQTYDRAVAEIPVLSVSLREDGRRLYLPLAADASWQKFAFEWGGGFFMSKRQTKAKGAELARLSWDSDVLHWYIGTGENPVYIRDDDKSRMSILDDYLPVPEVIWSHEGLNFREEAFVTLLEGPLSPYDAGRSEQTPAILMIALSIENPKDTDAIAHVWLKADSLASPVVRNGFICDSRNGEIFLRAGVKLPSGNILPDQTVRDNAVHQPVEIPAHQAVTVYISAPFAGDLTIRDIPRIAALDYGAERLRVTEYWRTVVNAGTAYNVPERKFNEMAQSVIPHIRISTSKDPKSGLFMVPAASMSYGVYSNESSFQTLFLDRIGDSGTAASYLETFLKLQGTDPMPGTFTGDQSAVFHGGRVDETYNYTSGRYNLDHGTVLWAMAQHYLLSRDRAWLDHAAPNMLRAADWIIEQRNLTKLLDGQGRPVRHYGLLPAGRLEDNDEWGFWFAVNAYAWLGLQSTADVFGQTGIPGADRLEKEAADYLKDIRTAVKRSSELAPVARLRNNTYVPFVPSHVYQRFRYFGPMRSKYYERYRQNTLLTFRLSATREALYGPMILITTGILEPRDSLSDAILDDWEDNITLSSSLGQHIHGVVDDEYWFSRGGMVFQPNLQNPIQAYLLRNEIPAAIRNIYNSMVSCLYRDVNAFTEEYRRWGVGSGPMHKIPDEARFVNRVCDMLVMESGNELWIAPGTPRRWLEPGRPIELYSAQTIFGEVSYVMQHGGNPGTVRAHIELKPVKTPGKIVLFVRAPFGKPMRSVTVNGRQWEGFDTEREAVTLDPSGGVFDVLVSY
ncbi:hypothetical protein LLG96_09985 [bacterium]|nr:hypothetical protein [bacterium]